MSDNLKLAGCALGTIAGTLGLNAGVNALVRQWFGRSISYGPSLISGASTSITFLGIFALHGIIKTMFNNNKEKADCILLATTLLAGGAFPKIFSRQVSFTHACALSILSLITSHVSGSVVSAIIIGESSPMEGFKDFFKDYGQALKWATGMDK
jgi:hypothetical protein